MPIASFYNESGVDGTNFYENDYPSYVALDISYPQRMIRDCSNRDRLPVRYFQYFSTCTEGGSRQKLSDGLRVWKIHMHHSTIGLSFLYARKRCKINAPLHGQLCDHK